MRQRQDRQHVQDADPSEDADDERHGTRPLRDAPQAVRGSGRALTAASCVVASPGGCSEALVATTRPARRRHARHGYPAHACNARDELPRFCRKSPTKLPAPLPQLQFRLIFLTSHNVHTPHQEKRISVPPQQGQHHRRDRHNALPANPAERSLP
ncbi:hypothetical protein BLAT2472_20382 [Burkholderia latens]